jgi:hypothetical protein
MNSATGGYAKGGIISCVSVVLGAISEYSKCLGSAHRIIIDMVVKPRSTVLAL